MTDKDILSFLKQQKQVSFSTLYERFNCNTVQEKKLLKKNIYQLQDQQMVIVNKKHRVLLVDQIKQNKNIHSKDDRSKKSSGSFSSLRASQQVALRYYAEEPLKDLILIQEKYNLPEKFVPAVDHELKNKIWEKQFSLEHYRKDLKNLFTITIDGADSKDLDDAVSLSKSLFGNWRLGVHIADVSYYVPQNTSLDTEAYARANSYYFINKVIPMLPKQLSNDLCSLNPLEEKKSLSIFMDFNNKGQLINYSITPSVIKTNFRMTYDRVEEIIKGANEPDNQLKKNVLLMNKFFRVLHQNRMQSGSVDFNFREKKFVLDEKDQPTKVYQKDRLDAERLIEEFMLAANQATGDFLMKNGLGLYRVHDVPPAEKYQRLRNFAAKRGHKLPDIPTPKDLQNFIQSLIGKPVQFSGEILTLRSMAQAAYQPENIGHFGLGFNLYAHFTSPIRRYADLVVHRMIKYFLYKKEYTQSPYTLEELQSIGQHISAQERIAIEAERDLHKIKSVRYMKALEGEKRQGKISSITNFGLFIEDNETGIEAMMRYVDMEDYFLFNEDELTATNRKKTKFYSIGMNVFYKVAFVNIEKAFVDARDLEVVE